MKQNKYQRCVSQNTPGDEFSRWKKERHTSRFLINYDMKASKSAPRASAVSTESSRQVVASVTGQDRDDWGNETGWRTSSRRKCGKTTTAKDLQDKLNAPPHNVSVPLSTIRWLRKEQGRVNTGVKYCQLIREKNSWKRKEFCEEMRDTRETFYDVTFTDECIVQVDSNT